MRRNSPVAFAGLFALAGMVACGSGSSGANNHLRDDNFGGMDPRCPSSWTSGECGQSCPVGLDCYYTEDGVNTSDALYCSGDAGQTTSTWSCGI